MQDLVENLEKYSISVKSEINNFLSNISPNNLKKASIYLTESNGKMLRPTLAIIICEAFGGSQKNAIKTAAAIELIHTFSLIHDDIMDKDAIRRGKPSVHKVWNENIAILAGDTLFSKAFELISSAKDDVNSTDHIHQTIATISDACVKICEGQALDIEFEKNFDIKKDEYLEMIFKKTGALMAAATKSGAIIGGANQKEIETIYEYGKLIGLAFQIQDDYLDLVGSEETLGKPVGSDIVKGKMTIIILHTLENGNPEDKEKLINILKNGKEDDISEALNILNKYESLKYAGDLAKKYVDDAKKLLNILDDSPSKKLLLSIADFVINRKK
ncbi:MAG: polyprenyl synthetase family protein [Methanobrevibacter sp.]|jgi:geranylgeranyl diphosphate synthase type I|nr:polyprenyl synthetase family protein [Candidatus Methanovirga aequatorialis]